MIPLGVKQSRPSCRGFCLMTVGRSGSTALMRALQAFPDIATPDKNLPCIDNELLHPEHIQRYAQEYARMAKHPVKTPGQLMQAFFRHNKDFGYAGFKSMPNRHPQFQRFAASPEIQFISLARQDVPSTVASFLTAMQAGCWRREGGAQDYAWRFDPGLHGGMAAANFHYVCASLKLLERMPNRIALIYEDLCREDFSSPELDAFFGRPIRLAAPKPPLHGSAYLSNWGEFCAFLAQLEEA
jgi:hypothetical protein